MCLGVDYANMLPVNWANMYNIPLIMFTKPRIDV